MAQSITKPRFTPNFCSLEASSSFQGHAPLGPSWVSIVACPADFPPELFETATSQLVHHPEYNSTLILRSEVVADYADSDALQPSVPGLEGFTPIRTIHRRLLPRRPGRDAALDQHCTFYASSSPSTHDTADAPPSPIFVLVLTPLLQPGAQLPYFHPLVSHLAFRLLPASSSSPASLRIEAHPLPASSIPTDPGSRLHRTALALLETLHRYAWGAHTQYRKRVAHDTLVPRDTYQDLYLVMRERWKHVVGEWREATDPIKHVFEDVGIATFLILLWKDTYKDEDGGDEHGPQDSASEPWKRWPRPPGGFVDMGCGNGLLTHILISEGYAGTGFDLRERSSWTHYPPRTRAALSVRVFDPAAFASPSARAGASDDGGDESSSTDDDDTGDAPALDLPRGAFLIGNHADELTPWLPVLAARAGAGAGASGYLSIPCCAWTFERKFERARDRPWAVSAAAVAGTSGSANARQDAQGEQEAAFAAALNLGSDNQLGSAYARYRVWLASLSAWLGWVVEVEVLRIPSTRNWAIVGRKRLPQPPPSSAPQERERKQSHNAGQERLADDVYADRAQAIIDGVAARGVFRARRPEGKAGDAHDAAEAEARGRERALGREDEVGWLDAGLEGMQVADL